eukprot:scaffold118717_cov50-Cyclotella_meneghiniana.AAC.1
MIPCANQDEAAIDEEQSEAEDNDDISRESSDKSVDGADDSSFGAMDGVDVYEYEYKLDEDPHDFTDIPGNEGYGIFDMQMLTAFIHEVSRHAASCSAPLDLTKVDKRYGAHLEYSKYTLHLY